MSIRNPYNALTGILRVATKPCARCRQQQLSRVSRLVRPRWQSTSTTPAASPKIDGIVEQISQLTLLETADLVASLKSRLNIPDAPLAAFTSPATTQAAPAEEEEDAAPVKQEKTLFNVKLESFEAGSKPKVIKEIKNLLNLSLVDSKKFVESAPKLMKEGVPKEDAQKMIDTLKALGAVVVME